MSLSWKERAAAAALLALVHVGLALLPEPPFSGAMNLVLYATNLYVLYCAAVVLRGRPGRTVALFFAGYGALFLLTVVLLGKKPLFILLVVAYASFFGSKALLGLLALFTLSFVVFQPYAFETFIPLSLAYGAVWRARRAASRFALWCLGAGLLGLLALLFPLVHLSLQDSAQTLLRTLSRPDVQRAIWTSLATSTAATAVVALWGVPLAYAMARLEFPGKRFVESLVDLPILVPQSVAGVAFLVLLGPGSPLGSSLQSMGVGISGTYLGVVLAQVFVAAPFLVKSAMTGFEAVPLQLELASRSLGSTAAATFWRVSLPLAWRGMAVGAALAWARAVSEFGCIILFASSPVTAPVLVHTEFLRAGASESRPIAVLLLVTCLWAFIVLRFGRTLMPFSAWRSR